jgi:hypothetical protein
MEFGRILGVFLILGIFALFFLMPILFPPKNSDKDAKK